MYFAHNSILLVTAENIKQFYLPKLCDPLTPKKPPQKFSLLTLY